LSELPEICPFCGSKLEKGYVFNPWAAGLFWSRKKITFWDREKIWSVKKLDRLTWDSSWGPIGSIASRCPHCMMVFLPYGERAKEIEQEENMKEKAEDKEQD